VRCSPFGLGFGLVWFRVQALGLECKEKKNVPAESMSLSRCAPGVSRMRSTCCPCIRRVMRVVDMCMRVRVVDLYARMYICVCVYACMHAYACMF